MAFYLPFFLCQHNFTLIQLHFNDKMTWFFIDRIKNSPKDAYIIN